MSISEKYCPRINELVTLNTKEKLTKLFSVQIRDKSAPSVKLSHFSRACFYLPNQYFEDSVQC